MRASGVSAVGMAAETRVPTAGKVSTIFECTAVV
jgi:hypothetical protein